MAEATVWRLDVSGCRALIDAIYGVGELTAITILAELCDATRFQGSHYAPPQTGGA